LKSKLISIVFFLTLHLFTNNIFSQHHEHATEISEEFWRLESDRLYWQLPNQTLQAVGIKSGMKVADVGAGKGYFAIRLAHEVGDDGKVYASDIDPSGLNIINSFASKEGLGNIITVQGKEDDPLLPNNTFDIILMVNVLHLIKNPSSFLGHLKAALNAHGVLAIVQWDSEKMLKEMPELSAEDVVLYSQETTMKKISDGGFRITEIDSFLPMQKIYICR
jgi:ubiquinone/menaquinone biosynthesis C-methylase UbiE